MIKLRLIFAIAALAALATMALAQYRWVRITVESRDGHHAFHLVRSRSVKLRKQLSDRPCIRGKTWGVDGHQIWVDHGCRAIFDVEVRR